ncbi:MAG: hypothetical protein N2482_00030 [Patescibacteria group bacterium]|nr:hypothetical protein [Patescibacteria group bacterium]
MKINFIYSKIYFKSLNRFNRITRSWEEVKKIGRAFEKKYQDEIKKITEIIPKIIKKPWRRDYFEVYLVDWNGPSFSHPLTLKVREDLLLMLVILVHELLHDFYFFRDKNIKKVEKRD